MTYRAPLSGLVCSLLAWTLSYAATPRDSTNAKASIRRTSHGVFHILADDYTGAGLGAGYAQAGEAICDIASRIVTVRAERSLYFKPSEQTHDFINDPTTSGTAC